MKKFTPSPKSPKSPKSPNSSMSPRSPQGGDELNESSFQIIHTPDRPERPISRTAIPNDEQCMRFLMSLQRQEEHKRGGVKNLKMWPYPDEELEDRRCLRSVRVESVRLEEARLARTNSSGPAKVVQVGRSSTKSTRATKRSGHLPSPSVSDADDTDADMYELEEDDIKEVYEEPMTVRMVPLSPPPTLSRSQSRLDQYTLRAQTSRWSHDSDSLFSSRGTDSPYPQHGILRSSAEVSSPTMVDDDSAGPSNPSTPLLLTPIKDRPATPFTDPRLRCISDPTTPPPSDHIVHQMSPESLPKNHSWRSSKETILNTGAPTSRFQSWLTERRSSAAEKEKPQDSHEQHEQKQTQPELEVYGDWADYYFEDGTFWDVESDGDEDEEEEGHANEKEDKVEHRDHHQADCDGGEVKQKACHLEVDGKVYPRYERFIKDYETHVKNVTVKEI